MFHFIFRILDIFYHIMVSWNALDSTSVRWDVRSIISLFSFTVYFPTGYCQFPVCTNFNILSKLKEVTTSGNVIFYAILLGTLTWSIIRLESGVMTVRAEKSTGFLNSLLETKSFILDIKWESLNQLSSVS